MRWISSWPLRIPSGFLSGRQAEQPLCAQALLGGDPPLDGWRRTPKVVVSWNRIFRSFFSSAGRLKTDNAIPGRPFFMPIDVHQVSKALSHKSMSMTRVEPGSMFLFGFQ